MMRPLLIVAVTALALTACGERDQSLSASASKADGKPWDGAKNPHVIKGWKTGDKSAWENQLKTRAQNQNEYVKVN